MRKPELVGVDLFGLDEFGQVAGVNPLWGAVAGAGLQSAGAMAWRKWGKGDTGKWAEWVGTGVGIAGGAAMAAMENTRAAGWTAIAAAGIVGALRIAEQKMSGGLSGLGLVDIERTYALGQSGSLGLVDIEKTYALGNSEMPQLVGNRPELVGGPVASPLASSYGATLFGTNG